MEYLVYLWVSKGGKSKEEYRPFSDLDDARDFADWKEVDLQKRGYEYDIAIYERTNY